MRLSAITMALLLLGACAAPGPPIAQSFESVDSVATSGTIAPIVAVETASIDDFDSGLVCEYRQRPGSLISQKYCFTREERAANRAARDELVEQQMDDLRREQAMREAMERQAEEQRRRRMAGFGR